MRWRRFLVATGVILLGEVAMTGRVNAPFFVVYAAVVSLGGTMTIGPRPRQPGRWWGTIDQQIALEAQEDTRILQTLLRGQAPDRPVSPARCRRLMSMARSEWLPRLWFSYPEMCLAALLCISFFTQLTDPTGHWARLVAQALLAPVCAWLGPREWKLSRRRLRQLKAIESGILVNQETA